VRNIYICVYTHRCIHIYIFLNLLTSTCVCSKSTHHNVQETRRHCVAVCGSVLQCVAVCCSVLQCVVVCCSVLQSVAECCKVFSCNVFQSLPTIRSKRLAQSESERQRQRQRQTGQRGGKE